MRRTQARQCELPLPVEVPVTLADLACRVCGTLGVTLICIGTNGSGAVERLYCTTTCGRTDGWPWLVGERARAAPMQAAE